MVEIDRRTPLSVFFFRSLDLSRSHSSIHKRQSQSPSALRPLCLRVSNLLAQPIWLALPVLQGGEYRVREGEREYCLLAGVKMGVKMETFYYFDLVPTKLEMATLALVEIVECPPFLGSSPTATGPDLFFSG